MTENTDKVVLNVGCGPPEYDTINGMFREPGWREIRLDIDPALKPDVVASMTDMPMIADGSMDAVHSSNSVEHLYPHEVTRAFAEFLRVLKPEGMALIQVPDLRALARLVVEDRLEDVLMNPEIGPVMVRDHIFGYSPDIAMGKTFMAHRTGFTGRTLGNALLRAGFAAVRVKFSSESLQLLAIAHKTVPEDYRQFLENAEKEGAPALPSDKNI
ncbi:MAG: methyltransferase domain-containing protein [Alphaproteobacteria bacterium]